MAFLSSFSKIYGGLSRLKCAMLSKPFFHFGSLLKVLNQTFITLIPKIPNPEEVSHFRPISLCKVFCKIISKVLVNRLKPIMDSIITPYQNAFIKGRNIFDNILLAHEIIDVIRKKKGRRDSFWSFEN